MTDFPQAISDVMPPVGAPDAGALRDHADDLGPAEEFLPRVARIHRAQPVPAVLDPILPEERVAVHPRHHVGAVPGLPGRVDDDDAAVGELRLHAVAEHAQRVGLLLGAAGRFRLRDGGVSAHAGNGTRPAGTISGLCPTVS